jgi:hypothetical protein
MHQLKDLKRKKISHRSRFKEPNEEFCEFTKTIFCHRYCLFEDSSVIFDSSEFDFLKHLLCPNNKEYIYLIWETKLNIIKIGKTTRIFKRMKQHISSFLSYGGSNQKDIKVIFARNPVSIYNECEQNLLNDFSFKCFVKGYIGEEFFRIDEEFSQEEIQKELIRIFNSDRFIF